MKPRAARPWPVAPALDLLERSGLSKRRVAVLAHVHCASWNGEGFTDAQADRVAVALGVHPVALWPDWFDVLPSNRCECGTERVFRRDRWVCLPCDSERNKEYRNRVKVSAA